MRISDWSSDVCSSDLLRWLYDRRNLAEARDDLAQWLARWSAKYHRLTDWAEETIEETFSFYRLQRRHHKHMKSNKMLERFNEELRWRANVMERYHNATHCWRLVRAHTAKNHKK